MTRQSSAFCARACGLFLLPVRLVFGISPVLGISVFAALIVVVARPAHEVYEQWQHDAKVQAWQAESDRLMTEQREELRASDRFGLPHELSAKWSRRGRFHRLIQ